MFRCSAGIPLREHAAARTEVSCVPDGERGEGCAGLATDIPCRSTRSRMPLPVPRMPHAAHVRRPTCTFEGRNQERRSMQAAECSESGARCSIETLYARLGTADAACVLMLNAQPMRGRRRRRAEYQL